MEGDRPDGSTDGCVDLSTRYIRVPPLLDPMDPGVISFANAHDVRTRRVLENEYSSFIRAMLWPRKRKIDLNTLIRLISMEDLRSLGEEARYEASFEL